MSALAPAAPWCAGALRRFGLLLIACAERLARPPVPPPPDDDPWPDLLPPHERVFELRTRILCGYY
ncbi:MAG TPA: hypothetical protein VFK48_13300 [Usitatibacter sp.]|nr:hypothetical protein [Usitatibacter sp.]